LQAEFEITFTSKNLRIPEPLKAHVHGRLGQLLRFLHRVHSVHLVHAQERAWHVVEITVHANGFLVRAEERAADVRSAVDEAIDKIAKQLRRYKERAVDRRLHAAGQPGSPALPTPTEPLSESATPDDAEVLIVRTKRFAMKPMSPDEAAMQMDLLGHDFFVFLNQQTQQVNVVYRRRDGQFGLIEPEV
jgi:putative sigma-54 modulation protein